MKIKNKKIIPLFVGGLTLSLLSGGYFVQRSIKRSQKTSAYSTSSLPTTIDLNDNTSSEIRNYYSSLNSLSTSERSGTNLLKNLKPILKNGQQYLSYDTTTSIWDVYCFVDRDWERSPASSIPSSAGTYNSSSNTITNYRWGGNSSKYENPYLHALYYNRDRDSIAVAYGDHNNNSSTGINREHIWPKGAGFDISGVGGARGDIMHLWAAHGHTNNKHSNYYYGYVDKTNSYYDEATDYAMCAGNLLGYSKSLGGTTKVFEPQDCDKGDIARACFYMVARYNYLSGSDSDEIDSNNPNLELVNNITSFSSSGYTSSTTNTGKLGIIQDLLEWNRLDPPDEFEIHRNNLCYNNFTKNRNPFIDFPEWAEFIWGKSTDGSYNSSSTGYATPYSDSINTFGGGGGGGDNPTPTVSNVSVVPSSLSLDLNGSTTGNLTATVSGTNNPPTTVTWSSLDSSVATVSSNGVVTAQSVGTTTIKATSTYDTSKYATCTVTVSDSGQGGGGEEDEVTVSTTVYSYASSHNWSNSTKYTSMNLDSVCTASVENGSGNTGKYYESGNEWRFYQTEDARIMISVPEGYALDSVTFTYNISNGGVLLDSNSNAVSSGTAKAISGTSAIFSVGNSGSASNGQVKFTSISVTYHSTSGAIPTITSISLDTTYVQTAFNTGDAFDYSGLVVIAHYSDDTEETITSGYTVSSPDMSSAGNKTVAVTYEDFSANYTITISDIEVTDITLNTYEGDLEVGNTLSLIATVYPSNATNKSVTWDTSNESVATVSDDGVVTAVGNGTATITCTSVSGNKTATCYVTVTTPVSYVTLNQSSFDLEVGEHLMLEATIYPSSASNQDVSWSSSNPSVATVNSGYVSALSAGTATITVTTDDGDHTASCVITVTSPAVVTDVTIDYSDQGYTNGQVITQVISDAVTIDFDKGSNANAPKYYDTGSALRCYGGNIFTVSSTYNIVSIDFTFASGEGSNAINANVGNYSSNTWTGLSNTVVFTIAGTSGHRRIKTMTIHLDTSGSGEKPFPVTPITSNRFKRVDSESELLNGTNVLIAYLNNGGAAKVMKIFQEGKFYHYAVDGTFAEEMLTPNSGYCRWTLGVSDDGYTFKNENNLYMNANNTDYSNLVATSALESTAYWDITINGTSSHAIDNVENLTMRSVRYVESYSDFGCENPSSTNPGVFLFVDITATTWAFAQNYLYMSSYTEDMGYCKDQEHAYYQKAKQQLLAMGDTYIYELQMNDDFDQAQERYEAWACANGDIYPYADNGSNAASLLKIEDNSLAMTIILVTVSTISLSAVYFASKRRRHHN